MRFRPDRRKHTESAGWSRRGGALALALLVVVHALAPWAVAQERVPVPEVSAGSVFAFNPSTGEVVMAQRPEEPQAIGSIVKVMTALVVVDHANLDDPVQIQGGDMVAEGYSTMWLQPGHTLTVEQLLTGMLVSSAGDAAKALARHTGSLLAGTTSADRAVAAFVDAMNAKAGSLGLSGSQFANPDGADEQGSWSTARDVAIMYAFLHSNATLARIAGETGYEFTSAGPEAAPYAGVTTNQLAGAHGVLGAKTGSTSDAGGCLVLAREAAAGETVIVALLGSTLTYDETDLLIVDDARWNDAVAIMDAIDAGWTPGQNLTSEPDDASQAGTLGGGSSDTLPDLQPEPVEQERSVRSSRPLLAVVVASGVLAFAAVFARSQTTPRYGSPSREPHIPRHRR